MGRLAPFRCAAFSITSCKSGRLFGEPRWRIDVRGLDWGAMFAPHNRQDSYDEDAFRRIAALSGWRLVKVVPANRNVRRLYYERAWR